jgi:hypothetical protein
MRNLLLCAILLTACVPHTAVVDGRTLPRENLGYTDHDYFAMMHYDAYPAQRGPSSGLRGYGGRVSGRVCGADVNLEAEYKGRRLELLGWVKPMKMSSRLVAESSMYVEVSDRPDKDGGSARHFLGKTGDDDLDAGLIFGIPPRRQIDFVMGQTWLRGRVGRRTFDLHEDADRLVGTMSIVGNKVPFVLDGWGAVWAMTPADQAAILPFMLTCLYDDVHLVQHVNLNFDH